jgi:hypothetical protein
MILQANDPDLAIVVRAFRQNIGSMVKQFCEVRIEFVIATITFLDSVRTV